jgi:TonB family protein
LRRAIENGHSSATGVALDLSGYSSLPALTRQQARARARCTRRDRIWRVINQHPVNRRVVRVLWSSRRPTRHRKRLGYALAFSIAIHAVILSLQFGTAGLGLPGFALPWTERRLKASELIVRLETPRAAPPAAAPEPVRLRLSQELSLGAASVPRPAAPARADRPFEVRLQTLSEAPPAATPSPPPLVAAAPAPASKRPVREPKARAKAPPRILAQRDPRSDTFKVPRRSRAEREQPRIAEAAPKKEPDTAATRPAPDEVARAEPDESARLEQQEAAERRRAEEEAARRAVAAQQKEAEARKQEEARRRAEETEARRLAEAAARQEAEEVARQRALALQAEQEARKVEQVRKEQQARIQQELKKQEELRRLALEAEALKRAEDAARQQALAHEKELEMRRAEESAARAKEVAERQRLEGEAAAQRERDRLAAQKAPAAAPGALSGSELAAKALEQLRAARIDPLRQPSPPARAENPRRRSLFGVERDVSLRMYVDSWRWKIERNGTLNYRQAAAWRVHENPVVTVSIRSDGSLEDVFIHKSSGVRELDDAIRRIARLQAPYSAFPPELARQYDVIEIRRVWFFDSTLRILDEM